MTEQEVLKAIADGRVTFNIEDNYVGCYYKMDGENIHEWVKPLRKKFHLVTNRYGIVSILEEP